MKSSDISSDKFLYPLDSELCALAEEAFRSGKFVAIEGGAIPIALLNNWKFYYGPFDDKFRSVDGTYRTEIIPGKGISAFSLKAFEDAVRLAVFAERHRMLSSLSLAFWDVRGVPKEYRKDLSKKIARNPFEALPLAYQRVLKDIRGDTGITVLLQSEYERIINKIWKGLKRKMRERQSVGESALYEWGENRFLKKGQIFMHARDEYGGGYSLMSTKETRKKPSPATEKLIALAIDRWGALDLTVYGDFRCSGVAAGRISRMVNDSRGLSSVARTQGAITIHVVEESIDAAAGSKIARGICLQEIRAGGHDEHIAHILGHKNGAGSLRLKREPWVSPPKDKQREAFEAALHSVRSKIEPKGLSDIQLYPGSRYSENPVAPPPCSHGGCEF